MSRAFEFADDAAVVGSAEDFEGLLAECAARADSERQVAVATIARLKEAGLFRLAAPRRLGGLCLSTEATARVIASLARGCPSTAWLVGVSNSNSWLASLAPSPTARAVFADGVPIVCGATAPSGRSTSAPGGRSVTGRWAYLSGCNHATWAILSLADKDEKGRFLGASAYVPMSDVRVEDTWFMAGLRGTGSNTGVVNECFVPEHLYTTGDTPTEPPANGAEPSDFVTMVPQFRVFLLAVMVGAAEGLQRGVVDRAKNRGITYSTHRNQAESQVAQREVGEAAAAVAAARALMDAAARQVDASAIQRRRLSDDERAQSRGQTAFATQILTNAAERLVSVAGSSAFAEASSVQRHWRDLSVAARHGISVPSLGFEIYGRHLLGVEGAVTPSRELV